jgi:acetyl-CoA carboxylase biotin carboxylase subunit
MAQGPGVRVDTHCQAGTVIPPYYDSLIAKLCVWAADRPAAVARMARALDETRIEGIATTVPLFREIFRDDPFVAGRYTTAYLTERADHLGELGTAR